ncbi:MAG TPA: ribbon-helix-helix protein, CopG family [Micromonosporaceae bacterium]|nr:ribbon-helix-helix protein, CopG family [Micromonosporaceae bacterium]
MSRDRVVSVRLTDDEHEALRRRAKAAGRSLSQHLRDILLRPAPQVVPVPGYGNGTVTLPNPASIIWLTDGHSDGGTHTVAA